MAEDAKETWRLETMGYILGTPEPASTEPKANDRQVGGSHYKMPGAEEHWDRVHRLGLDYFQGQITKYVERWKIKNGLEDLEKALHFLEKYIELQKKQQAGKYFLERGIDPDSSYVRQ